MKFADKLKKNASAVLVALSIMVLAAPGDVRGQEPSLRERLLMDAGWRFALGHAADVSKDFNHATGQFSYFAKTGYGSGASESDFDDRAWREVNLPHDWAVELPFSERASSTHGYKAIGQNFPANSVGWYRKSFTIPASDLGRRISIEFDGVFRDSTVWINGHYVGNEVSGYSSFARNITEYLHYGGANVIVVRVNASLEEGWFYEGAGIYRHVWLVKTPPLHVQRHGTFVTSIVKTNAADVTARVSILNEETNTVAFDLEQSILDADGKTVATPLALHASLDAGDAREFTQNVPVVNPRLWDLDAPHLYRLVTLVRKEGVVVDRYETSFGIRSIRFDPNEGFFLNGRHVKLKGTDNHQDHAGVGVAMPDALQEFRLAELKKFGCNAYRCSHNPPTPELLDACDRMGILVIDENRLMGTTDYHYDQLRRLMLRDRNHPCVVLWSVGNEEWRIEGNDMGARITSAMQAFARKIDPTRPITVAISGGWGNGSSKVIEVAGVNYIDNLGRSGMTSDQWHARRPDQPMLSTEESAINNTRGIYFDDRARCHLRAYDWDPSDWGSSLEQGWSHYADRPFLAGMFVWTGFDYRGEPTPFEWPAICSQFGVLDLCGFPKDASHYLKAWWTGEPVLHIFPHWNWPGREGQEISVWAYANCEEVELFLNGQSQGRKAMKKNSHLEWPVKYSPGVLLARGYTGGKEVLTTRVETTTTPASIQLSPHRAILQADGADVSVITVQVNDAQGRMVPTADNTIGFELSGPGRIIGVGNGDPSSHEPDVFVESVSSLPLTGWRMKTVETGAPPAEVGPDVDDSGWRRAFDAGQDGGNRGSTHPAGKPVVYRASFEAPSNSAGMVFSILPRSFGEQQSVYLNGQPVAENLSVENASREIRLASDALRPGRNVLAVVAVPRAEGARLKGNPVVVRATVPPSPWKRSVFNGLAQVIVQSTPQPGEITLTARSGGLAGAVLKLKAKPAR
jgi:beta-galactosidase